MSVPRPKRKQPAAGRARRRPDAGRRVATHEPGIYRYVSPRGPEYDTFYPKIGKNQWLAACRSLEEAKRLRLDTQGIPKDRKAMTVREFAEDHWMRLYAEERELVSTTVRNYNYDIKAFVAEFGDRRPIDIGKDETKAWARRVSYQHFKTARTMLNDAVDYDLLGTNPLKQVRKRKPRGRLGKKLPKYEAILEMAEAAPEVIGPYGVEFRAFILFAVSTLMRPGELFQLKWEDIDFVQEVIIITWNLRRDGTIGDRKTHKPAVIPLLDLARAALHEVPRRLGSPFVFHNQAGEQMTASAQNYYWKVLRSYYAGRRGSEYARLAFYEATKHCGATWMRNELGLDREQLRIMLGHTPTTTTSTSTAIRTTSSWRATSWRRSDAR
jgi:integrase